MSDSTEATLRPGDVVVCAACGDSTTAFFTSGRWIPGYPVSLVWKGGSSERWHVTHFPPTLCPWCFERRQALGEAAPPLQPARLRPPAPPAAPVAPPAPEARAAPSSALPGQLGLFG